MAVGVSRAARISAFVIEKAVPRISNEIKRNDGVVAVYGAKGRIHMVDGGDLFEERVEMAENSNFAFRAKDAQISTNAQSNWLTAKFGQAVLSGALVINEVEEAQNQSKFAISKMIEGMYQNCKNTIIRQVADALRASSPTNLDPESIPSMCPATAFGSQTGTFGNLSRSDYSTWWNSQYDATGHDLSSQTGVKTLEQWYWQNVSKGTALSEQPDFGLTTGTVFSSLSAFGDNQRRYASELMQKLGFSSIQLLNAAIIADPSITPKYLYFINTNYSRLQVLRTPQLKTIGDTPESLPISVKGIQDDIDSLNKVQLWYLVFNLTTCSLQRQGLAITVT